MVPVEDALASIVRPVACRVDGVAVMARDPRLDAPLAEAATRLRLVDEPVERTAAVRAMYRRLGLDPTKHRPSSEALLRRVRKGDALPRVNSLVDVINWCSVETQLPFGLYDTARLEGAVTLRRGRPGESYPGIRKDEVHVDGRLVLADARGAFGNPTSDSLRTAVTEATTSALVVIFAPAVLPVRAGDEAMALTLARIGVGPDAAARVE